MKCKCRFLVPVLLLAGGWMADAGARELVLKAAKDNFGRSNLRNCNSGRAEALAIAHAPNIRTIIAFDLGGITNEIVAAEFRFRPLKTNANRPSLVVAPMVQTTNNAAWVEGQGNLGTSGQNARPGESCYGFRAFPTAPWEAANGAAATDLSDSRLWLDPVATLNGQMWNEDRWIRVPISRVALLDDIRKSDCRIATFGIWGTAGNGYYFIGSNNSPFPPELLLTLKEGAGK